MGRISTDRYPFVLHDLINVGSFGSIGLKQRSNQILGIARYMLPFWTGKIILSRADTFLHSGGHRLTVIRVERRIATEPRNYRRPWKISKTTPFDFTRKRLKYWKPESYRIYMMTPRDHMSQDVSYFSGPSTSGAIESISFFISTSFKLG